jgi:predicted membrane-bound dolichyl-phosphate-mannose-protein mannosyltransferase
MLKAISKKRILILLILVAIYLVRLFSFYPQTFTYRFNPTLVDRYFLSQDIPHEVDGKRVFLSDGEIHEAAGYLYWHGHDPSVINFQHPPFLKYLFGVGIVIFNNPYLIQISWGVLLVILTFSFGLKVFKSLEIATLAGFLLAIDPLLSLVSSSALLDLGQAVLVLLYIFLMIGKKKSIVLTGVVLGLIATSKFWAVALFFILLTFVYSLLEGKEIQFKLKFVFDLLKGQNFKKLLRQFTYQFLVAAITMSVIYLPAFIYQNGKFNIIFFELKSLKYWLNHSVSSVPLASLGMFLSGFYKTWWDGSIVKTPSWNLLWPLSFVSAIYLGLKVFWKKKKVTSQVLVSLMPILYLIYLGVQAPFERYFIIILPFLYLTLARILYDIVKFYVGSRYHHRRSRDLRSSSR